MCGGLLRMASQMARKRRGTPHQDGALRAPFLRELGRPGEPGHPAQILRDHQLKVVDLQG